MTTRVLKPKNHGTKVPLGSVGEPRELRAFGEILPKAAKPVRHTPAMPRLVGKTTTLRFVQKPERH